MKEIWNAYWAMIHDVAEMIHSLMYYASAKVYFAERRHNEMAFISAK